MERVLPRMGNKLFVDANARGIVPLLPLDNLRAAPARPASPAPPPAAAPRGER